MNNVSFQGKFVSTVNVMERYGIRNHYIPSTVNFVKLDPMSKEDLSLMHTLSNNWSGKSFARPIYTSMLDKSKFDIPSYNYFVLTKQNRNFENLCDKDILGMTLTHRDLIPNRLFVSYLQTKPKYINKGLNFRAKFKNIGKAMLSCLKKEFPQSNIELMATDKSVSFYEKLGFIHNPERYMTLSKDKNIL